MLLEYLRALVIERYPMRSALFRIVFNETESQVTWRFDITLKSNPIV
jgi:hypothetical protein